MSPGKSFMASSIWPLVQSATCRKKPEIRSEALSLVQARMSANSGSLRSLPGRLVFKSVLFAFAIAPFLGLGCTTKVPCVLIPKSKTNRVITKSAGICNIYHSHLRIPVAGAVTMQSHLLIPLIAPILRSLQRRIAYPKARVFQTRKLLYALMV